MEEFIRGFHKGKLMGSKDACQRMLGMEKIRKPKAQRNAASIDDEYSDEELLKDYYIEGMQKALEYLPR